MERVDFNSLVRGWSLCICINHENSSYFKPGKGLGQGDPLSPLLFNLVPVGDVFTKMLSKDANCNLIKGPLPNIHEGGLFAFIMLMTPYSLENRVHYARNLKWILISFQKLSELKISYDKSDILNIGQYGS